MVDGRRYVAGEPCWADVTTPDVEAAKRFYGELFGWTFADSGPEFGGYVTCSVDGRRAAGITPPMPGADDAPPVWTTYLWSDDAAATAKLVEAGGGTVLVPPMEIGDNGTMLVAADPGGAVFGVWQPDTHRGAEVFNEPGGICWAEVNTREPGVDAFYKSLFGYEQEQIGDGSFDYTAWMLGSEAVAGRLTMTSPDWDGMPAHWMIYFVVPDADAAAEKAVALGGRIGAPPFDSPHGRIAVLSDPHGATFSAIDVTRKS